MKTWGIPGCTFARLGSACLCSTMKVLTGSQQRLRRRAAMISTGSRTRSARSPPDIWRSIAVSTRQAIEYFEHVHRLAVPTKFFLHWIWRMTAQLESGDACLRSGDISKARSVAEDFLHSALSTADPHLQALGWDLRTRVAMAEKDFVGARDHIQRALAIVEQSEIPIAAWQTYASAWQLYRFAKEHEAAEAYRERAESCVLKIADSFEPDEPLRSSFLSAAPVCRILRQKAAHRGVRQSKPRYHRAFPNDGDGSNFGVKSTASLLSRLREPSMSSVFRPSRLLGGKGYRAEILAPRALEFYRVLRELERNEAADVRTSRDLFFYVAVTSSERIRCSTEITTS